MCVDKVDDLTHDRCILARYDPLSDKTEIGNRFHSVTNHNIKRYSEVTGSRKYRDLIASMTNVQLFHQIIQKSDCFFAHNAFSKTTSFADFYRY